MNHTEITLFVGLSGRSDEHIAELIEAEYLH
jgi:hypothetical protein